MCADEDSLTTTVRVKPSNITEPRSIDSDARPLVPSLWTDAYALVSKDLRKEDQKYIERITLDSLLDVLQDQQTLCVKNRWKRTHEDGSTSYVADDIERIASYFRSWSDIVSTFASYDPGHVAIPWAFVQTIIKYAGSLGKTYGVIAKGVKYLASVIERYVQIEIEEIHRSPTPNRDLRQQIINVYAAILTWLIQGYKFTDHGRFRRWLQSAFPNPVEEFSILLDSIKSAEIEAQKALSVVQWRHSKDASETSARIEKQMTSIVTSQPVLPPPRVARETLLDSTKAMVETKLENLKTLREWLKAADTTGTFRNASRICHPRTSLWVLSRDPFRNWSNSRIDDIVKPRILWINGPPGFGKTVLCAQVLQSMRYNPPQEPKFLVTFFCSSENEERRTTSAILRSWIDQLVTMDETLQRIAAQLSSQNWSRSPTEIELWEILRRIATNREVTLVVDGLDECQKNTIRHHEYVDSISQFLASLIDSVQNTNTRILICSRGHDNIKVVLHARRQSTEIYLEEQPVTQEDTTQDVLIYTKSIIETKLSSLSAEVKDSLAAEASLKAEGMFLYVNIFKQGLRVGDTAHTVRQRIVDMPEDLKTVYKEELQRILEPSSRKQALAVFRWLLFAVRPLTLRELAEALILTSTVESTSYPLDALPPGWNEGQIDEAWVDAAIVPYCGSFVELRKANDSHSYAQQTVHFAHASMREFLLEAFGNSTNANIGLQNSDQELDHLGTLCLRYLCYDIFSDVQQFKAKRFASRFPFIFYATKSWYERVLSREKTSETLRAGLTKLLNPKTGNLLLWSEIFEEKIQPPQSDNEGDLSSQHNMSPGMSIQDNIGALKLQGGNTIGHGAEHAENGKDDSDDDDDDDNDDDSEEDFSDDEMVAATRLNGTSRRKKGFAHQQLAIYYASLMGLVELLEMFYKSTEDEITPGVKYGTPLQAAVIGGKQNVVDFLLRKGAAINTKAGHYGSALNAAASTGNLEILKQLLNQQADPFITDEAENNALHLACESNQYAIVKLLLKHNQKLVTSKTKIGNSPICSSIETGNLKLVKALHNAGADLHQLAYIKEDAYLPMLNMAIEYRFDDIAKYLIKQGVDIEARDHVQNTAILCAARDGNEPMYRMLRKQGADLSVVGKYGMTTLHMAVLGESKAIVQDLLDSGMNANVLANDNNTPMMSAVFNKSLEIFELLLGRNVTIDSMTRDGHTALHFASSNRVGFAAAKILLEHGADPSLRNVLGSTPFDSAVDFKDNALIRIMISKGALSELSATGDGKSSELQKTLSPLAVFDCILAGQESQILSTIDNLALEEGFDQSEKNNALLLAVHLESITLTRAFLVRGAETACRDKWQRTPLHIATLRRNLLLIDLLLDHNASLVAKDFQGFTPAFFAVTQGIVAKETLNHILQQGGWFNDSFGLQGLRPAKQLKELIGTWTGAFTMDSWIGDVGMMTIPMLWNGDPKFYPYGLPWFSHEGRDDSGQVNTIGFALGEGRLVFLRLNEGFGWYCEGKLEEGPGGPTMTGHWGAHRDAWYGKFTLSRLVEEMKMPEP